MNNRWGALLAVIAAAPLVMGAGGFNPPTDGFKVVGPAVSAVIVVDAHNNGATAGRGAIRLQKGTTTSGTVFTMPQSSQNRLFANFGCDASRTEARFENAPLLSLVGEDTMIRLFADLGITVVVGMNDPIITDVDSAACTVDPAIVYGTNAVDPQNPGTLSFQAVIQFVVPSTPR